VSGSAVRQPSASSLNQGQVRALALAVQGAPLAAVLGALVDTMEAVTAQRLLACIFLVDRSGPAVPRSVGPSLPDALRRFIDSRSADPQSSPCGWAVANAETVVVPDLTREARWATYRDLAATVGVAACWVTPISSPSGEVLGTFALHFRAASQPTEDEVEAARILSGTAALVLERQLEGERRQETQRALDEATNRLQRIIDSVPGLISYLDAGGHYRLVNQAYERWFGPGDAVLGRHVRDVLGARAWRPARR
jgi:GAF domain-containing protein